MKKTVAWLMAVLLLFPCLVSGEEAVREKHDVYDLYALGGERYEWTGAAVPLMSGLALTSLANLPERVENTGLSDGTGFWNATMVYPMAEGHTAFVFFDLEAAGSDVEPWPLTARTDLWNARDLYVLHGSSAGDRLFPAVSAGAPLTWEGADCMILTLSGAAAPGDPVLTDGNELAGMIVAEYAEGSNRYIAMTAQGILSAMVQLYAMPGAGWTDGPEEGYTVTVESNRVTFDWSGVKAEAPEGEHLWLVVLDTANDYLNYVPADLEQRSCTMLLTPGRTYLSGLTASAGTPSMVPERYAVTALPEAEPLTEHDFRPVLTTLARSENGETITERISEPVRTITAEELRAAGMHFYSWSVYTVAEQTEDTLLISLTMPDGTNYRFASGWIYDPSYMEEDIWSLSLESMGFSEALEKNGYAAGTYEVAFYVGGKLADSFTFEIR